MMGQKILEIGYGGFLIIAGFFAVKFVNEFIYSEIIQRKQGIMVLTIGAAFVITLFGLSIFAEKVINNRAVFVYGWVFIILVIILGTVLYGPAVLALALAGIMFYAFIGSEAQVLRSIEENFGLSRILLTAISFPLSALLFFYSGLIDADPVHTSIIFIVESIFALMISYHIKRYQAAVIMNNPPILLGVFFMIMALILFYAGENYLTVDKQFLDQFEGEKFTIMMFVVPFYFVGAMVVYLAIEDKILKIKERESSNNSLK